MAGNPLAATFDLTGLAAWAEAAGRSLAGFSARQPLAVCRQLLASATLENFAGGHAPDGTPWLPLARPRANSRGSDKPLRDKGILMGSVTGSGAGHVEQLSDTLLVWGTNLDYAAVHQHGATIHFPDRRRARPWVFQAGGRTVFTRHLRAHDVVIPARPFVGLTPELLAKMAQVLADYAAGLTG